MADTFCSVFDLMNRVSGCLAKSVERGKRREVIGFPSTLSFWNCGLYGVIEGERKSLCFLDQETDSTPFLTEFLESRMQQHYGFHLPTALFFLPTVSSWI